MRTGRAEPLAPVFHHNQMDLCGLAGLSKRILSLLGDEGTTTDDGLELFGLSRICERRGEKKRARQLYEQSIATVLPTEADRAARHALARLAEQNGDLLRARELWKSTLGNFRRATKPTSSWRSTLRTRGVSLCKPWRLCGTRWPNCTTGSKQERLRLLRTAGRKHGSSIGLLVSNTGPGGRCSIKFHRPNLPPARPMTNSNWITGCWRRSSHGWRKAVLEKKLDALLAITFVTDLKELRSRAEKLEDTDAELDDTCKYHAESVVTLLTSSSRVSPTKRDVVKAMLALRAYGFLDVEDRMSAFSNRKSRRLKPVSRGRKLSKRYTILWQIGVVFCHLTNRTETPLILGEPTPAFSELTFPVFPTTSKVALALPNTGKDGQDRRTVGDCRG